MALRKRGWRSFDWKNPLLWIPVTGILFVNAAMLWHMVDEALLDLTAYIPRGSTACLRWVEYLRDAGYRVRVEQTDEIAAIHSSLRIPPSLAACHTSVTEQGHYVIEGHVPTEALARLLADRPRITGLAVPGGPAGAPGIGAHGTEPYELWAFSRGDARAPSMSRWTLTPRSAQAAPDPTVLIMGIGGMLVAITGSLAYLGTFARLKIVEKDLGPFVLAFPALADPRAAPRAARELCAELRDRGVRNVHLFSVLSELPRHRTHASRQGCAVPERFQAGIRAAGAEFERLPHRRYMVVRYPRGGALAEAIGALRVQRRLSAHRAVHRYSETELYAAQCDRGIAFVQPIRGERSAQTSNDRLL